MAAPSFFMSARLSAANTLKINARDNTVVLLAGLFFAMVLISAYLGWSATATVNAIYAKAVPALQALGRPIPANPVGDTPVLSLFRNMVPYVALLGGLAAIVLGHQSVAVDRKSGVLPLLFSRPVSQGAVALGKGLAIVISIVAILFIAAVVNAVTMLILPGLVLNGAIWFGIVKFYLVSLLYLTAFGFLGAYFATTCKTESMALLIPVSIWLGLTFIVPQVTSNIGPMAALNPLSANLVAPSGTFFDLTSRLIGPFSIAEAFRYLASTILEVKSGAGETTTTTGAMLSLLVTNLVLMAAFVISFRTIDASRSDYRD